MSISRTPQHGDIWQHAGGRKFMVLGIANQYSKNERYEPTVVYVAAAKKWDFLLYSCPLNRWDEVYSYVTPRIPARFVSRLVGAGYEIYDVFSKKVVATATDSTVASKITELLSTDNCIHPGQWRY